ncbi:MAG TPA: flagellar biosynthetic protein FliO [Candidatus Acidoferrum sp.]|nr:flagellar biosynthetic protein FliO [Candidatus Acidoferrum sp.]
MKVAQTAANAYGAPQSETSLWSLLFPLFGVLLVIFLAYAFTWWLAKKYRRVAAGRCARVVERVPLGKDRDLVTVETDGVAYLLGVTGGGVTVICSYDAEKLPQTPEEPALKFAGVLEAVKKGGGFFKIPPIHDKEGGEGETKGE